MNSRIILIPLFRDYFATSINDSEQETPLEVPQFASLLPHAVSLTLYSRSEELPAGNEFLWNVRFRSQFDRMLLGAGSGFNIAPAFISTNGSVRHAPFTDTTKFQLESRLSLVIKSSSQAVKTGRLSAVLAVETVGR